MLSDTLFLLRLVSAFSGHSIAYYKIRWSKKQALVGLKLSFVGQAGREQKFA